MDILKVASSFGKIASYSRLSFMDGIYKSASKNVLKMKSVATPEKFVTIPLSCFSRTQQGDIVLYRGLHTDRLTAVDIDYSKSVAASLGINIQEILKRFGKRTKKTIREIATYFSGLTQGNDPILHTTAKRKIAKRFARDGGILVEYHIPKKWLQQHGFLSHLGEEEIDFFYKIPKKYVAKVTHFKPKTKQSFFTDIPQEVKVSASKMQSSETTAQIILPPPPPEIQSVL